MTSTSPARVGTITWLARYPVKSMAGEELAEAAFGSRGVAGDRDWATYTTDGGIGSGKSTRRFRRVEGLLSHRALLEGAVPLVVTPTGIRFAVDAPDADELLSSSVGRRLSLRREDGVPHHDEAPVHVVTTTALRALERLLGGPVDVARFRPNVLLEVADDVVEGTWEGRELRLGPDVVLRLGAGMPRCAMVDMTMVDTAHRQLPRDGRILRTLAQECGLTFGLQAHIVRAGVVRRGDPAYLI